MITRTDPMISGLSPILSYSKEHPFGCSFIFNWTTEHRPSRRTASPNGSDWESEAYGLLATINTQGCFSITQGYFPISVPYSSIRVPYSHQKKSFFRFYPHILTSPLSKPDVQGIWATWPFPVLPHVSLTFWVTWHTSIFETLNFIFCVYGK